MEMPTWANRTTIQIILIVVLTFGIHYYFITTRLGLHQEDKDSKHTNNDNNDIIEQNNQE